MSHEWFSTTKTNGYDSTLNQISKLTVIIYERVFGGTSLRAEPLSENPDFSGFQIVLIIGPLDGKRFR